MVRTKLKTVNPRAEDYFATFDTVGIEKLLYVIKDFLIITDALGIDRTNYDELKKYFKKLLGHGPAEKN